MSVLIQIIAWSWTGDKPLSGPLMIQLGWVHWYTYLVCTNTLHYSSGLHRWIHRSNGLIKGSRSVLDGLVVTKLTMHEDACERKVQSLSLVASGLDVLFAQAWVHFDNKTQQISFNPDYSMTFLISPSQCYYSPFKSRIWCLKQELFWCCSHCCTMWCPLTMELSPHNARWEGELISACSNPVKTNSTTIKHICDESANLIDSYNVAFEFDTNDWWYFP